MATKKTPEKITKKKSVKTKKTEVTAGNSYTEDDITVIKDDILRLRKRPEMYIGYIGSKAFLHITKEILQNSIDEAVAMGSYGKQVEIWIYYNQKKNIMRIVDNGRGMPIGKIVDICSYIQASGKFDKGKNNAYEFAAGLNGVGATATNALSDYFKVVVCRDGVKHETLFKKGRVVTDKNIGKSKDTGTDIEFKPDESILGKVELEYTTVLDLAETMAHLTKTKIHVHITGIPGKDGDVNKTFKSNGIVDKLVDLAGKNMLIDPIYMRKETTDKNIEIAMTYVSNRSEELVVSYANYCTTVDHGTPLVGVKQGLTQVMVDYIKENCLSKKEKETLQITGDDCRSGWVCVINANHINPSFVGQVKEKIGNPDLTPFAKSATVVGLKHWIETNDKEAKKIGTIIKKTAKLRIDGQKIRQNTIKEINAFNINHKKFCRATGKENLELIMVEGLSAKGPANQARDKSFQEIYAMKGVPKNTYGLKYLAVRENEEFNELITIMNIGIGPKKDYSKRRHERYIIMTDADIDGYRIRSLLAVFFLSNYPEIIEEGRLYISLPPLYSCKNPVNGSKYIQTQKDLNKLIRKNIMKKHVIYSVKQKRNLEEKDIKTILDYSSKYLRNIKRIANDRCVNPILIEFIAKNKDKSLAQITKLLNKHFRFIEATNSNNKIYVTGTFNKSWQYAVIDKKLFEECEKIKDVVEELNNSIGLEFKIEGETKCLYELMLVFEKLTPDLSRFKGLGEMQYEQLEETTLDPNNRRLIRLTSKDIQKDLERFAILHSSKKKAAEERAKLFEKFEIDIDDIDN